MRLAWLRRGLGGLLAATLIAGGGAGAQEALISSLSIDRSLAPPQNAAVSWGTNQMFLGPVVGSLGVYVGAQYNDNINSSQFARESDSILSGGLNLGLTWPATDNSVLRVGTGIGWLEYLKHSQYSGLEISPDSALTWQIGFEDGSLSLYDQFSYLQQGTQQPALANLVTLPRLDNDIGARVSWEPRQWLLQIGYSYDYFISPSATYDYLDRDSEYLFTRDAWRFAEHTQAGLEASLSLTHYLKYNQGASQSLSVGPYAEWQATRAIMATARGGEVFSSFDPAAPGQPGSRLSSGYLGLEISDKPADFFSHNVSVVRETELGINQGSAYLEQITATYNLSLTITPRISLDGSVTWQKGSQPLEAVVAYQSHGLIGSPPPPPILVPVTFTEHFDFYGGGPTLTWRLTDKLTSSLNYSRWQRLSNVPGRTFSQNTISLNLSYNFW